MSVAYRPRHITADPAEVRAVFLKDGYRGLERCFSRQNDVVQQLIALAGGPALLAERRALQRTGRKAGGKIIRTGAEINIINEAAGYAKY